MIQSLQKIDAPYYVVKPHVSFEEYMELADEDSKAELIEGELVMHSPASFAHERIFQFLTFLFRGYVSHHRLGEVLGSRFAVKLSETNTFEPDILFISNDSLHKLKEKYIDGAPELVVELLSDSTKRFDLGAKKEGYLALGVKEYWVVDIGEKTLTLYYPDGKEMQFKTGKVTSHVIPGFWLDVAWLFELPSEKDCLDKILSGTL